MKDGFTLIEIMIVAAIIVLLAVIAAPGLLRDRINANQAGAQAVLRTISTACENYAAANRGNYPAEFSALAGPGAKYLYEDFTSAARQGYVFSCGAMSAAGYACTAVPASANAAGTKSFSICTGGILKEADGMVAPACP